MLNAEPGIFVRFKLETYADGGFADKHRYMLLVDVNDNDRTLVFVNISSLRGKVHQLQYEHNYEIINYEPLPEPSFAKLDSEYVIENCAELLPYFLKNRKVFSLAELENILNLRDKFQKENKIKRKILSKDEFIRGNIYKH